MVSYGPPLSDSAASDLALPPEFREPRWYAAYTKANHEKRVSQQLDACQVQNFLPVYASARRWKDRTVKLEMPLFPGYVFVRMALADRLQVLQVPGVAWLVGFAGKPAALPSDEVEILRASLAGGMRAEPHPYLAVGRRVRLRFGPLEGLTGILLRKKHGPRFVVSVDLIQRSIAVELDEADLVAEH
jgi:transcription antitermination factor NusG